MNERSEVIIERRSSRLSTAILSLENAMDDCAADLEMLEAVELAKLEKARVMVSIAQARLADADERLGILIEAAKLAHAARSERNAEEGDT